MIIRIFCIWRMHVIYICLRDSFVKRIDKNFRDFIGFIGIVLCRLFFSDCMWRVINGVRNRCWLRCLMGDRLLWNLCILDTITLSCLVWMWSPSPMATFSRSILIIINYLNAYRRHILSYDHEDIIIFLMRFFHF